MLRTKRMRLLMSLGMLLAVVLAACQPATTPEPTEAPEEATAAPTQAPEEGEAGGEPIIFGMVAPMTGDLADYGTQVERGIRMAIDEINAEGGVNGRPLDIKICDDKCDPTEAAACAQRLSNDPEIFAVLGHICSSCTLAGGPIYDAAGVTVMTVNSSNPTITEQGWEHMFRSTPHDGQQGPYMAQFAVEELGAKKIAIIYGSSDYGRGLMEATRPVVPDFGGEVVAVETYAPGEDKDFSAQLTKIAQAEPDALLVMGQYADGALIAKQRVAAGLGDIPLVACAANQHSQFIELGGQGAEGAYIVVYFDLTKPEPRTQEIVQKTLDKYGEPPAEQVPWGYDGVYIFAQAIEAGATKETMPEYLSQVEYDGVTGHVKFDEKNQVVGLGQDVIVVENGEFVSYTP
jgi:branched-chain amino acid transport system substrate-binding protein